MASLNVEGVHIAPEICHGILLFFRAFVTVAEQPDFPSFIFTNN